MSPMSTRTLPATLALALALLAPAARAQNAAPTAPRAQQPAPAAAPTAAPAPARTTAAATPRTPAPPPARAPSRRSPSREPDLANTAAQVLNGVVGVMNGAQPAEPNEPQASNAPRDGQLPVELLRNAGLDPARLPGLLGPFLRSDAGRANPLSSGQLRQLGRLARRNLNARQLESVATTLSRAGHDEEEGPTLSSRELNRVAQLASQGASSAALRQAVTGMLRGN